MTHVLQDSFLGTLKASETDVNKPYGISNYNLQIVPMCDETLGGGEFIYVQAPASEITGETISSIAASAVGSQLIITVTTGAAHGLTSGANVLLTGQAPSTYSGAYTVDTVPSTTTFTAKVPSGTNFSSLTATTVGTYTANPITKGDVVELEYTLSSGVTSIRAKKWAGTANTGKSLAIAYVTCPSNNYFWVQVAGLVPVQTTGTPAIGDAVYYSAAGKVKPTAAAGKQIIGAEFVSTIGALFKVDANNKNSPTLTNNIQLLSTMALVNINRPKAQGAIT